MEEFVSNTIELMKTGCVFSYMIEFDERRNDPAGVLADLMHYCDLYMYDFDQLVHDADFWGKDENSYENSPVNIISDLIEWCEQKELDFYEEINKAQIIMELDQEKFDLYKVLQL